jgi:Zn-finger nucleic acid-binding protein
MRCPVDKTDMIVVEHQHIELDYCLQCRGVWFDAGELDLLVSILKSQRTALSDQELLNLKPADVSEVKRKCPICNQKMEKRWIGNEPFVLIDSCPRRDGLWFDGGELHHLCQIGSSSQSGAPDLISFLGDTFKADCQPDSNNEK